MTTLGQRLRAVRGSRSQSAFADSLGISKGALVSYEHDRSSPNAKLLMTICLLEQIEIKWLLAGEGERYRVLAGEDDGDTPQVHEDKPSGHLPGCPHCAWMEKMIDRMEEDRRNLLLENKKLLMENASLHSNAPR